MNLLSEKKFVPTLIFVIMFFFLILGGNGERVGGGVLYHLKYELFCQEKKNSAHSDFCHIFFSYFGGLMVRG